jgi:hypothetical protein
MFLQEIATFLREIHKSEPIAASISIDGVSHNLFDVSGAGNSGLMLTSKRSANRSRERRTAGASKKREG